MGISPIIFTFYGGNVADSYRILGKISLFIPNYSSEFLIFFVHHDNNIAWTNRDVNRNLGFSVRPS